MNSTFINPFNLTWENNSLEILGFIFVLIVLVWVTYKSGQQLVRMIKSKGCSPKVLFKNFRLKMWMTIGLGTFFFSFYILMVTLGSQLIHLDDWLDLFFAAYNHPFYFLYLGLFIFVFISCLIILIRLVIKYFYVTHHRE